MKTHLFTRKLKKALLSCGLLAMISGVYAQDEAKTLPVLHESEELIHIWVDGQLQPGAWMVCPQIRPDVYPTAGHRVKFANERDSVVFDIEKNGKYDFVVLTAKGDSAFIRIQWESENPLEEPSNDMLQRGANGKLSKTQAQFDVDALIYTLGEVHPNMFSVCKQEDLFRAVNKVKNEMPDSVSVLELFRRVAPLVTQIGDGHTMLRFPYNDVFTEDYRRLPLSVKVSTFESRAFVDRCIDQLIPEGAEVISINGVNMADILAAMIPYASGERSFFRLARIDYDFAALFEMLYAAEEYDVAYREEGGTDTLHVTLRPTTFAEIKTRMPEKKKEATVPDYSFQIMKDKGIAVMDFRYFNDVPKMKAFADSMFSVLNKEHIGNLIIDIRNNGGGNSAVGDMLLRYISSKPFQQMGKGLVKVTPTTLRLKNFQGMKPGWTFFDGENENGLITPLTEAEGHYKGKVYLLTSHMTFSSASSFAWAFKYFGMGTVIGEETGGMSVSFGDILRYKLPVSGLSCSISWKRFWLYGADENDIHGTLPDYPVPQEEALDKAFELIKSEK